MSMPGTHADFAGRMPTNEPEDEDLARRYLARHAANCQDEQLLLQVLGLESTPHVPQSSKTVRNRNRKRGQPVHTQSDHTVMRGRQ